MSLFLAVGDLMRIFKPDIDKLRKESDVDAIVKALRHRSAEVRTEAAEALYYVGDVRAVDPLVKALKDKELDVRKHAAEALGKIGDTRAVEPLISSLKRQEEGFSYIIQALGKIGDTRAVDPLIFALDDKNTRIDAARALGRIGDPRAVRSLIYALESDPSYVTRMVLIDALGKIGDVKAVGPLVQALGDEKDEVQKEAKKVLEDICDTDATTTLIEAMQNDYMSSETRRGAAELLGKVGNAQAVGSLVIALKDADTDLARIAAEALGKIGDTGAVEPLIQKIKSSEDDRYVVNQIRKSAAEALGRIQDMRAVDPLIQIIKSSEDDNWVREEAAKALGQIGDKESVDILLHSLVDDDKEVRSFSALALGTMGNSRAVEPLINALKDDFEDVRKHAVVSLGNIGDTYAVEPLIEAIEQRVCDCSYITRALGKLGDERAIGPLIHTLQNSWWHSSRRSGEESQEMVQFSIAEALRDIGESAIEPLILALKDEDFKVRTYAAKALGMIGDTRAIEPLIGTFEDRGDPIQPTIFTIEAVVEALLCMGEPAIDPLLDALKNNNPSAREYAAYTLGKFGDPRATIPLLQLLPDDVENVIMTTLRALGKIADPRAVEPLLRIRKMKPRNWDERMLDQVRLTLIKHPGKIF